jgi:hypothetical protein
MKVLAKFKCNSIKFIEADQQVIEASPVVSGSEENKSFSRWTPAGKLEMVISNETNAGKFFNVGEEFYLTLSKQRPE